MHNKSDFHQIQEEIAIQATLQQVQFSSRDSAFFVGRFLSEEGDSFTAAGELLAPSPGDDYILNGSWTVHPKYGRQFKIASYEIIYPVTTEGIEQYLASGLIRGIGKVTAQRIVRKFGDRAIEIMNSDIGRLLEVEGIGAKTFERIKASWDEQRALQNVMLFLKSHGISTGYAVKIFRTYGAAAVERIQQNPYSLVDDVDGIGFVAADTIAQKLGLEEYSSERYQAGILYTLRESSRSDGHTYLTVAECAEAAAQLLETDAVNIEAAIHQSAIRGRLVIEEECVFLPELYHAERAVAERMHALTAVRKHPVSQMELLDRIADSERESGREFSPRQAEAIMKSISGSVTIITGGPGTGKTTTVQGIIDLANSLHWQISLCAPTGRAAKRLSEVTGTEAKTIHRLLEFDPRAFVFLRNEERPLEADILIVDEMSMVDVRLMAWLLQAVPQYCRLVLVGDADQLPSVGPGNVLRDLIASESFDTVSLTMVFRQAADSSIVSNAHRVNHGEMPVFGKETFFIEQQTPEAIASTIREIVVERIPREMGYDPLRDIQVLSPMHQTVAGVRNLNQILKQDLNPAGTAIVQRGQKSFAIGDKVMQVSNNYEKDVFNGDIGFIGGWDEDEGEVYLQFDDRTVTYTLDDLDQLVHAYATTIHKSQGSEYEIVVLPLTMQHRIMLQRNLIYTAMTRAKTMLVFVGQQQALRIAVQKATVRNRNSMLRRRILEILA